MPKRGKKVRSMKILSLDKMAEEAGYIAENTRYAEAAVTNVRTFEQNYKALDRQHPGAYAFVAFHPAADHPVEEYISDGTLGDDAGPDIIALFMVAPKPPRMPREINRKDAQFGVTLSLEQHPAYELARRFFARKDLPRLPGLVFFDRLCKPGSSIYVLLEGIDKLQIRLQCRTVFEAANRSLTKALTKRKGSRVDFDRFAARLVELNFPYHRAGKKGLRAAALITGAWIKKNQGAIAAAIPKLIGLGTKAATGSAK